MTNAQTSDSVPLDLTRRGAVAIATLARTNRRNALTPAMQQALLAWYPSLARDPGVYAVMLRSALDGVFSVGGDVREILDLAEADVGKARAALADELRLYWLAECFSKPTVSLIDGVVMGSGVGVTFYGTHRVAGESYSFRMPETAIGYVPDCGLSHAFARLPHAIGLYLGLTGAAVGPADALALGLVTHCIPRSDFPAIEAALADADPVDPVLDARHRDPGPSALLADAPRIGRYFSGPRLAAILAHLERPETEDRAWAAETLATLRGHSPLALCLTDRAIRNAADFDIRQTLIQDYRLAHRLVASADFREGVRARLIDKDQAPRWVHAMVEDVPTHEVEGYFAPLGPQELALPSRTEMQAARV